MSSVASPARALAQQRRRSRLGLLLLALIFVGPPLLAPLLYYGSSWRPASHTNHGVLIQPPRPLSAAAFQGKWSLVYIGAGDCDADCRNALYYMRQTHWGLGQFAPRVQRLFLVTARCCDRTGLERAYPGLITLDQSGPAGAALLAVFPADARATSLFIVDPRGNLMMRYDSRAAPKGLLEDLTQLLRLSGIG
jgi:hypothetical protein